MYISRWDDRVKFLNYLLAIDISDTTCKLEVLSKDNKLTLKPEIFGTDCGLIGLGGKG